MHIHTHTHTHTHIYMRICREKQREHILQELVIILKKKIEMSKET